MRRLPIIITFALLSSCATMRNGSSSASSTYTDTLHVTVTDTTHVKVIHESDSTETSQSHRRDSIIIKEVITNHYDPASGILLEQVIDKLTSKVTDDNVFQQTILRQQQVIDSLITANLNLQQAHHNDSIYSSNIKEKGDAARSGWQSTLKAGSTMFIVGLILVIIVMAIQFYLKPRK